ncbi:hypothetical protein DFH07DRAFT_782310 [Mycena maculata]|uniref:Uncharacterized protein n=1 Tax=Mycena maculata TaxID=230809 RepID=A0AAD7HTR1_9AGAR|nr:hypothetical protein DFH07DRAFT_782310 [Mycena maculata]
MTTGLPVLKKWFPWDIHSNGDPFRGDSHLFDGTAWYLQRGTTISLAAVAPILSPHNGEHADDDEPRLLAGTQTLKHLGFTKSVQAPKRLKDITPNNVEVESLPPKAEDSDSGVDVSPSAKQKQKQAKKQRGKKKEKTDGWIWLESLTRGQNLGADKMAEYKTEIQWFCAEAEMYRWLEQYERKHAELMRVIERFRHYGEVWMRLADCEEERNSWPNHVATFARMQTAMYNQLEHNMKSSNGWMIWIYIEHTRISSSSCLSYVIQSETLFLPTRRVFYRLRLPPVLENRVGGVIELVVVAQPPHLYPLRFGRTEAPVHTTSGSRPSRGRRQVALHEHARMVGARNAKDERKGKVQRPLPLHAHLFPVQFNLCGKDRTQLHQYIASSDISDNALDPQEACRATHVTHAQGAGRHQGRRIRGHGVTVSLWEREWEEERHAREQGTDTDEGAHNEHVCSA